MAKEDWGLVALGLLVGIPVGVALLWSLTHRGTSVVASQSAIPVSDIPSYSLVKTSPVVSQNEETWEWIDWKGRERKITVHRVVKNG